LVVLAVSDEAPDVVRGYLDQGGYSVRTSAGSQAGDAYGVRGIPDSFLIGPDGKIVWQGSPFSLTDAQIEEALRGVKPGAGLGNLLAVPPSREYAKRLKAATDLGSAGKPAKALAAARAVAADEKAEAVDKVDAEHYAFEITGYLGELQKQIDELLAAKEVQRVVEALETLSKEFGATPEGKPFAEKLAAVKTDKSLSKELDAAKAYQKLQKDIAKLSASKAKVKQAEFAEKWKGTRAGERAMAASRKKD
jgi:hypothetical protein